MAAQNKTKLAPQFERAIELDPSLANAWLGRGLVRIRSGDSAEGRADLLTAAALEPQRGFLRSYLAKAWTDANKNDLAAHEIELAKGLNPQDPTAWLYSALLKYQQNRINEAVRELEHAQTINTNRAVYRSGFLLDQDQAVRSANLARIYRDAGMIDWSIREAAGPSARITRTIRLIFSSPTATTSSAILTASASATRHPPKANTSLPTCSRLSAPVCSPSQSLKGNTRNFSNAIAWASSPAPNISAAAPGTRTAPNSELSATPAIPSKEFTATIPASAKTTTSKNANSGCISSNNSRLRTRFTYARFIMNPKAEIGFSITIRKQPIPAFEHGRNRNQPSFSAIIMNGVPTHIFSLLRRTSIPPGRWTIRLPPCCGRKSCLGKFSLLRQ